MSAPLWGRPRRRLEALLVLFLPAAALRAACGSATCPIDPASLNLPMRGEFSLDLSFQYIDQDQPRAGRRKVPVGFLPSEHDEVRTVNRAATLLVNYAPAEPLILSVTVPWVSRFHEHLAEGHDEESLLSAAHETRETWHFDDVGDVAISARYRVATSWWATGSVKLATGERRPRNAEGEIAERTVAPGTGSTDFTAGILYQGQSIVSSLSSGPLGHAAVMPYFAGLRARVNGRGTDRYRIGNEIQLDAGVLYPVWSRLQLLAQVNARVRGKDDVADTGEERAFTGGSFVFASPGLRLSIAGGGWALYGYVQFPIYQRVNGLQLTADANYFGGVQARF